MRIGIIGVGQLGTDYGSRLLAAGEDAVFVARGRRLQQLREHGLSIDGPDGTRMVGVTATDDPAAAGVVELLLFCVKTYDLEEAAAHVRPMVGNDTVVVPVQNGLYAADRLVRILGPESVVGGVARDGILIGELDGPVTPRLQRVADMLERVGIGSQTRTDIRKVLWEKQLQGCGWSVATATRLSPAQFVESKETVAMFRAAMEEAAAVANASGADLDPEFVDRYMATFNDPGGPPAHRPSLLQDLEAGRRMELEDWAGTAVRLGQELGVPTPVNNVVYAVLKPHANGKLPAAG